MIRVLLVDDHIVVRQGLRRILETDEAIEIVGETGDGRSAIELTDRLQPDVVVMDVMLPELGGIEATNQITQTNERARVLILSMVCDHLAVRRSLRAGARGYLPKDSEDRDLLKAVKAVASGGTFFGHVISQMLIAEQPDRGRDRAAGDQLAMLTDRERQVLELIAEGKPSKKIAALLSISPNTVETYRKRIMEKLDLHNTAQIVRFALKKNIIS